MPAKKVCVVGSGNWGSAIARVVGQTCAEDSGIFDPAVRMWVFEEQINGRLLTDIINTDHENVKYLPGHKLPQNVVAVPDLKEAAKDADILIFVLPHQFIRGTCNTLKGNIKPTAMGISLIKGFEIKEGEGIVLISKVIEEMLEIPCGVLMGANLAKEVAGESFAEATIAFQEISMARQLKALFQRPYFRISCVTDSTAVELCGSLKNIIAVGAGLVDGMKCGDNTKAAVIRLGLMEMIQFCEKFYGCTDRSVFFESCGVADLVTTCYGGRHRKVAEAHVLTGKSFDELEKEMLNGQILQGPVTAKKVYSMFQEKGVTADFPLMVSIYRVCYEGLPAKNIFQEIQCHPQHL